MLVTAESCTGGWLAKVITDVSGSSRWFERGFVTYSNEAKVDLLGVRPYTLRTHGAVSEETVREMVAGALRHGHAQVAIAVTGIAGPEGGTPEKPVGTVWLAAATGSGSIFAWRCQFSGSRDEVRRQAVAEALNEILGLVGNVHGEPAS